MRFLADESCDFAVVRALRAAGHDVMAIAEMSPRAEDEHVIGLAIREGRILLTEDKGFGQLVYASKRPSPGVVLFRFPATARALLREAAQETGRRPEAHFKGRFIVVQPGRVRIGRGP